MGQSLRLSSATVAAVASDVGSVLRVEETAHETRENPQKRRENEKLHSIVYIYIIRPTIGYATLLYYFTNLISLIPSVIVRGNQGCHVGLLMNIGFIEHICACIVQK